MFFSDFLTAKAAKRAKSEPDSFFNASRSSWFLVLVLAILAALAVKS
jgi:hypothetical protein